MSTEEEASHQDGPAWKIVAKCATYEEADQKRLELAPDKDLQVKVHWQGVATKRYFAVKTRTNPEATEKTATNKVRRSKTILPSSLTSPAQGTHPTSY